MLCSRMMDKLLPSISVILLNICCFSCYKPELYKSYRLEKLCRGDGGKVTIGIRDVVSSFYLNSSLVPGETFNCHIEMVVRSANTGMFVYFEEMYLSEASIAGCNQDFVQFGRDILFVTSHLSKKYCGRREKVTIAKCDKNRTSGMPAPVLNLSDRIYSEERDREMDVWIRLSLPKESNIAKTLTLVVTPFKKHCSSKDADYRKCGGTSPRCIRKELFCDGRINCAVSNESPEDEKNCSWIEEEVKAPESWSMPFLEGFLFLGLVGLICGAYYAFTFLRKNKPGKSEELQIRDQHDLVQFNHDTYREEPDTVVPVQRPDQPTCPPLPLPPPYSQIGDHDIVPQYSYSNR